MCFELLFRLIVAQPGGIFEVPPGIRMFPLFFQDQRDSVVRARCEWVHRECLLEVME